MNNPYNKCSNCGKFMNQISCEVKNTIYGDFTIIKYGCYCGHEMMRVLHPENVNEIVEVTP